MACMMSEDALKNNHDSFAFLLQKIISHNHHEGKVIGREQLVTNHFGGLLGET